MKKKLKKKLGEAQRNVKMRSQNLKEKEKRNKREKVRTKERREEEKKFVWDERDSERGKKNKQTKRNKEKDI